MLIEQSEDIGSGYLAPLFFASIVATRFYGMPIRDGMALGVIMNTKGILSLIILNIGWNRKVVSQEAFTIMVFSIFFMTVVVAPIINAMYKPRVTYEQNKLRTIENLKADSEVRVMACVHNVRQANGMTHILEACNGTNISPLRVFGLQLVERKGRATALLVAQIDQQQQSSSHQNGYGRGRNSLVLSNLLEWADCPELGVIGDMLASNSFGSNSSILVVQQYGFGGVEFKTSQSNCKPKSQNDDIESLFPKGE
ncbi:hypothetical protein TSUD_143450 [Trifolium subterraneum]|uniref:Cation/H+ exchanger domain-containing protein n=1 Tax=Trifolium subterraneum TaxID=3900 RepID=A0A2Z6N9R2_TRISU|nr:hypothetical protein TSUD_143450 [Trifolium subterraneum]